MPSEIVVAKPDVNPLLILQQAVEKGATIEQITALMGLAERWEVNQDKRALREAMAEFKKDPPAIIKNRIARFPTKTGGQMEYSFSDLENITTAIQSELAERGVTHSYTITESGTTISVTCILKYGMYEEPGVTLSAGPDDTGNKNAIQQKASTVSYLEKYTLLGAVGMAAGMPDNDGNTPTISPEDIVKDILSAKTKPELVEIFNRSYKAAAKNPEAQKAYRKARDQRLSELEPKDGE